MIGVQDPVGCPSVAMLTDLDFRQAESGLAARDRLCYQDPIVSTPGVRANSSREKAEGIDHRRLSLEQARQRLVRASDRFPFVEIAHD